MRPVVWAGLVRAVSANRHTKPLSLNQPPPHAPFHRAQVSTSIDIRMLCRKPISSLSNNSRQLVSSWNLVALSLEAETAFGLSPLWIYCFVVHRGRMTRNS